MMSLRRYYHRHFGYNERFHLAVIFTILVVAYVAVPLVVRFVDAVRGYDPAYGARPLRRLVAKAIGDELARRLLAGELGDGDTVVVDAHGDRLTFTRRHPAAVA